MTLTFEKPRCMAYDRHSVDARCEYEAYAARVGYCVECRPSHPDDVHTLVVTQYGDAHPRCYDGYTREWLGGVDLGSKNGVSIDPGPCTVVYTNEPHVCPIRSHWRPRGVHQRHSDSPTMRLLKADFEERERVKKERARRLRAGWRDYAAEHGRDPGRMCHAWRYQQEPTVWVDPDKPITVGGHTLHQMAGCCADLGIVYAP